MEQVKKVKVVWICHFSNEDIRKEIPLAKNRLINFFLKLCGKSRKNYYPDFAPWVSNLIKEFEKLQNIELHVISPHKGLKRLMHEFTKNGIHYCLFKPELPLIIEKFIYKYLGRKKRTHFINRLIVRRFLRNINPDIINLIGTENPYYSLSVLDINNIPVFVSVQTVYTNPMRQELSGQCNEYKWDVEMKIHKKLVYYGCSGRLHHDLILKNNPNAIIFKNFFPIQKPENDLNRKKEFDFVFFAAGVTPKKGIEDAIEALAIVKEKHPFATFNIVGRCGAEYKKHLIEKIKSLSLSNNIIFHDYFPVHSDMHLHIQKSKFALLPVKLDVIPGSIIEAMLLELPVVSYKTSGTPYLNKDGETVLLGEIGNIKKLAENMLLLLNSPVLAEKLKIAAKNFVEKEFDNTDSAKRILANYFAVIDHYHHKKSIPDNLLFILDEFPIYS
jgi:glycosyltransferase involved in cell wall biosynthesis